MDIRVKQIDGVFKDLTKDSVFTDYTNQAIQNGTAVKIVDAGYFTEPITTIQQMNGSIRIWDAKTNQWSTNYGLFSDNSTYDYYGYNVFTMDRPNNEIIYFCKDDEIQNLPEYDGAYTRSRLNSHVNQSNFNNFQTIKSGSEMMIPLTVTTRISGSDRYYCYAGLKRVNTGSISFGYLEGPADSISIYIPANPKANISKYIIYKDTTIQDMEARVKALEDAIISITAKLEEHDKILKDLPSVVAAVSSNVAKLYVAR